MSSNISNTRRWFQIVFPAACFFVFAYPLGRLSNWYSPQWGLDAGSVIAVWLVSVAAVWYSFSGPKMKVRYVVVHWMGISFILASLTLAAELVRVVLPLDGRELVLGVLVAAAACVVAAIVSSHHLSVRKVAIESDKLQAHHRIVQISDVHIGSRQDGFMARIVRRINQLAPDFVVITGDLIDSSAVEYEALVSLHELQAPVYFSIGNHERYANLTKIIEICERLGLEMLRQRRCDQGELSFIGVDDADYRDQLGRQLPSVDIDTEQYNILLYHRPVGWRAARDHGIDLMLSGHTHNGQIFPFNYIVKRQFDRIRGLHSNNNRYLYVSSGTGTWGPLMRLGSLNEITLIELGPRTVETR